MTYYETIGNYLDFEPWHVRNELDEGGAGVEEAQFAARSIEATFNRTTNTTAGHSELLMADSPYRDAIESLNFE